LNFKESDVSILAKSFISEMLRTILGMEYFIFLAGIHFLKCARKHKNCVRAHLTLISFVCEILRFIFARLIQNFSFLASIFIGED